MRARCSPVTSPKTIGLQALPKLLSAQRTTTSEPSPRSSSSRITEVHGEHGDHDRRTAREDLGRSRQLAELPASSLQLAERPAFRALPSPRNADEQRAHQERHEECRSAEATRKRTRVSTAHARAMRNVRINLRVAFATIRATNACSSRIDRNDALNPEGGRVSSHQSADFTARRDPSRILRECEGNIDFLADPPIGRKA